MSTHGRVTFGSGAIGLATWTRCAARGERVRLVSRSGTKIAAKLDVHPARPGPGQHSG
jgi:NAD(P)-dependent dehydrogenase (short-subunit alcohol dehydrogenase family)